MNITFFKKILFRENVALTVILVISIAISAYLCSLITAEKMSASYREGGYTAWQIDQTINGQKTLLIILCIFIIFILLYLHLNKKRRENIQILFDLGMPYLSVFMMIITEFILLIIIWFIVFFSTVLLNAVFL